MTQIRVTVRRCRPADRGGRAAAGWLVSSSTSTARHHQTYGSRDLDVARAMVLEYLATAGTPTSADAVIEWVETGT
ncbi:hypothetical protein GS426_19865 [Rhodococcus hoagii]|nr:hypothetical protein [Prescottella equi]